MRKIEELMYTGVSETDIDITLLCSHPWLQQEDLVT